MRTGPNPTRSQVSAFLIIVGIALLLIAYPLVRRLWRARVRAQLYRQSFPAEWSALLARHVPLYARLPPDLRTALHGHIQVLLAEKDFHGARGLEVTIAMRLIVLAQAALLLLQRPRNYFPDLYSIVLHPAQFVVQRESWDNAGVQHIDAEILSGESWSQGQLVLSWDDSLAGGMNSDDGFNVVLHEFAHQLDHASGETNGVPVGLTAAQLQIWTEAFLPAFEDHVRQVETGVDNWLDPYAAENPAEFFAVLTEYFFEKPHAVQVGYPAVYAAMQGYFGVDPRGWTAAT